jgi:drug/metabolite transporter (DMT)-like permease
MGNLWHMALLLVMGIAWGLHFSMLKLAAERGIEELEILTIGMFFIALFFVAIIAVRGALYRLNRDRLQFLVITGFLGYVAPLAAAAVAAAHVAAGIMTLLVSLTPIITVIIALAAKVEAVSVRRILAVGLGMAAAVLVIAPQSVLPGWGVLPWLAVVLLVPLCYGVETVYVAARWPSGLGVFQVVAGESVTAFIMLAPLLMLFGDLGRIDYVLAEGSLAIAVFVLAGLVEVLLYFYLVQKAGAVFATFGTFVSLFAGIGWGMLLFDEVHGALVWVAVALLVGALSLVLSESRV